MSDEKLVDVAHVFDDGAVHLEVVYPRAETVATAAHSAVALLKAQGSLDELTSLTSVEGDTLYVDVEGNGVSLHLALKMDPKTIGAWRKETNASD